MDRTKLVWRCIYGTAFVVGLACGWPAPDPVAEAGALPAGPATPAAGRSPGCGDPPPAAAPDAVEVAGRRRELIVAVPAGYDPQVPHDLVVAFHGRTSPAEKVRRYYELEPGRDGRHGPPAIFVYPSALKASDGKFSWQDPGDRPGALRDYTLFDRVLQTMSASYCIDKARVFVVGHSLGATFANGLACARGADIRGVATIGGGIDRSDCRGSVAALVMHNPKDDLVPVREGERARDAFLKQDGLAGTAPERIEVAGFACERWGGAAATDPVVWCRHDEDTDSRGRFYPHTWPEAAGPAIVDFFADLDPPAVAERD
jgi:polyhydroxybutyrate depolymerase